MVMATALLVAGCSADEHREYQHPPIDVDEPPQYGGELNIGTVYVTLSPLSWDAADWSWEAQFTTRATCAS